MKTNEKIETIMNERFGKDTELSLATINDNKPFVRTVNSYYDNGVFYTITNSQSNKMKHIEENPTVAVCGQWFSANGTSENLGWVKDEKNKELTDKLTNVFSSWIDNGHVDLENKNTCILRIKLNDGVLYSNGEIFNIDFNK